MEMGWKLPWILELNLWICGLRFPFHMGMVGRFWVGSVAEIPAGCGNFPVGIWMRAISFQENLGGI